MGGAYAACSRLSRNSNVECNTGVPSPAVSLSPSLLLSSPDTLPPSLFDVKARKERAKALAADDPAAGKRVMLTAVDTMLWQTMASVLVPGLTINRVCVVCVVCVVCACCVLVVCLLGGGWQRWCSL